MESANLITNTRTQLCVILLDVPAAAERKKIWNAHAEEFLRLMHKLGIEITIIGPRPVHKFGSKKNTHFMDRHEVIGMKELIASKSHRLEFRILGKKSYSWTRLRAEACVVWGAQGIFPKWFDGWAQAGILAFDAFTRFQYEFKFLPGRQIAFMGSSNRVLRSATHALKMGAKNVYIVETGKSLQCWRAHRDRFLAAGGKILLEHEPLRTEREGTNTIRKIYLKNQQGTLILDADTFVVSTLNETMLNSTSEWQKGKFFIQRRTSPLEPNRDEEEWLERLDWQELYWRVGRSLGVIDQKKAEGSLKTIKLDRKRILEYREKDRVQESEFQYSGKILDRDSVFKLQASVSVPKSFVASKPVASLECAQKVPCRACADACPEDAIEMNLLNDLPKLLADKCTGCGACVSVCPAGAAIMIQELPQLNRARYFIPDTSNTYFEKNAPAQLLNRKGEVLGTAKITGSQVHEGQINRLVEIESSNVHVWEGRAFKALPTGVMDEITSHHLENEKLKTGWVQLNGVRRMVQLDVPVTMALTRIGLRRFEDVLFCNDGSCRLCEIKVNGKPALACKSLTKDGISIELPSVAESNNEKDLLCYCRKITKKEIAENAVDGATVGNACERLGYGTGACHGKLCEMTLSNPNAGTTHDNLRASFSGFKKTPWHDIWASEVFPTDDSEENAPE